MRSCLVAVCVLLGACAASFGGRVGAAIDGRGEPGVAASAGGGLGLADDRGVWSAQAAADVGLLVGGGASGLQALAGVDVVYLPLGHVRQVPSGALEVESAGPGVRIGPRLGAVVGGSESLVGGVSVRISPLIRRRIDLRTPSRGKGPDLDPFRSDMAVRELGIALDVDRLTDMDGSNGRWLITIGVAGAWSTIFSRRDMRPTRSAASQRLRARASSSDRARTSAQ